MNSPRTPDPHNMDPAHKDHPQSVPPTSDPSRDPAGGPRPLDPILADRPANTSGRNGLIAAGIIAVLLVIAVIAFTSGTVTDPGTTAVIPQQNEQTIPGTDTTTPDAAPQQQPLTPVPSAE